MTVVTFPSGAVQGDGVVTHVGDVVVVDRTPFHPVDHTWPDQPGDSGRIIGADGASVTVEEAVMAAISDDGALAVGVEIPVKRGASPGRCGAGVARLRCGCVTRGG
jgi:alanyl-tRNA synthetase